MLTGMITFTIALATSFVLTVPVRRLALRIGMVDQPNPRKLHHAPMPLLGGLAIYCGTVVAIAFSLDGQPRGQILGILAGATLLLATGILDDRGLLHHQVKLFVAMPLAAAILVAVGLRLHIASSFLPGRVGADLDSALTPFWVVGITAAFSILDHMDGLVSGVAAIASFFFALLAVLNGQVLVAPLAAAVFGASLGFLHWNFKPAKIFMGDGGAMFLGFMLATLSLKLRPMHLAQTAAWAVPVLVLAIPIFDTTLVTISRSRRGLLPFATPGKDHTAHRLANLRLGQRGAVLVIYAAGIFSGILAVVVSGGSPRQPLVFGAVLALTSLAGVAVLETLPYERQQPAAALPRPAGASPAFEDRANYREN
jgi:UDP-GlcNAc:undecaprenyl-phosphate/decaprenyl-phosphate GlcNAc-1-phosphate transferase